MFAPILHSLEQQGLKGFAQALIPLLDQHWYHSKDGNLPRWLSALDQAPKVEANGYQLNRSAIRIQGQLSQTEQHDLAQCLKQLMPWRKGPWQFFDIEIDSEWRSDFKWDRLAPHLGDLRGHRVLDVGCANGYHCWRLRAAGASLVLGIDPGKLPVAQFWLSQNYIQDPQVGVLPLALEQMPLEAVFDTVLSMGVLYHRRSPLDHLEELRQCLKPGGQLLLETLVIEGELGQSLVPPARYARMNNVWFLPSIPTLSAWLERMGFIEVQLVDINYTSTDEQRSTPWKPGQSLPDYLDPEDPSKTIEGHPAPMRASFIARVPKESKQLNRYRL